MVGPVVFAALTVNNPGARMMRGALLFALALAMLPVAATAESTCTALVITGHPDFPPVTWAKDRALDGAAPELVAKVARSLGVAKVTAKNFGSWEKAQAAARSGEADIIMGLVKTDERATYLDFIEPPFMVDSLAIAVRQGDSFPFAKWEDLKGRNGVNNAGESWGKEFDAFMAKELNVAMAPGVDKAFAALIDKKADYLIIGRYSGQALARQLGLSAKVAFLPKDVQSSELFVAFSKRSKCLQALKAGFAAGIKSEVEQGKVKELLETATRR
jgi:polar amino acid transport system substrate-binding protein